MRTDFSRMKANRTERSLQNMYVSEQRMLRGVKYGGDVTTGTAVSIKDPAKPSLREKSVA